MEEVSKICLGCGIEFITTKQVKKFCSCSCRDEFRKTKKVYKYSVKKCDQCHKSFHPHLINQRFCSAYCHNFFYRKCSSYCDKGIPTGTVGTIQELKVSVDLLIKGYAVFRALSPSCFCDLLVHKNNTFYDVEVRTGYQRESGNVSYSKQNIRGHFVAIVLPDRIIYKPELPL